MISITTLGYNNERTNIFSYELHCSVHMMVLNDVCLVLHVLCDLFVPFFSCRSLAVFWHILVFNCYYSYLFYDVLENKIYDDDDNLLSWCIFHKFVCQQDSQKQLALDVDYAN